MIYYAIIIGLALILIFLAYARGYQDGWRDSSRIRPISPEEHSSHADPTVPRELQRH